MTSPIRAESLDRWKQFFAQCFPELAWFDPPIPNIPSAELSSDARLILRPAGLTAAGIFQKAQNCGRLMVDPVVLKHLEEIAEKDANAPALCWIDGFSESMPEITPPQRSLTRDDSASLADLALLVAFEAWDSSHGATSPPMPDALIIAVGSYLPSVAMMPLVSFSSTDNRYHAYALLPDELNDKSDPSFVTPRRITPA